MVLLERSSDRSVIMSRFELYRGGLVHYGKNNKSDMFLYVRNNTDGTYSLHRGSTKPKINRHTPIIRETYILKKDNPLVRNN